jgi:isoquinoline 1-oxidoreductase beta subunit
MKTAAVSRRTFLSTAAAGGLVVGFHVPFAGMAVAQGATPEVNAWVWCSPTTPSSSASPAPRWARAR